MQRITPCLWFDGQAEEAIEFYMSIFKNAKIAEVMRWGEVRPDKKDQVLAMNFELDGQPFMALNGGPEYKHTPAISMFVGCETQAEVDYYWERLLDGGMQVQCGWLTDKFGVSWQIAPVKLGDMLRDQDTERADRVMRAMMEMVKLDLDVLQRAYDNR